MDWTTLLRSQQADFIQRLNSGHLLHYEIDGQHSELTAISGEGLDKLRDFCWAIAEKYKRNSPVRDVFINNLKGKLGEEVVKARLADFVTEVDYEKRVGGDGKVDFTLTSNPDIGIQVKARHASIDSARWSISSEEVKRNVVIVCVLIQEKLSESQPKYNLVMAGFLPTKLLKYSHSIAYVGINELLYSAGLRSYLESLICSEADGSIPKDIKPQKTKQEGEPTTQTIKDTYVERQIESLVIDYFGLGNACYERGDYQGAIANYNRALQLNPNLAGVYGWRGRVRSDIGDKLGAIEDFKQLLSINPIDATAHNTLGIVLSEVGDIQGAIEDYTQALKINPDNTNAYYHRGVVYSAMGEYKKAIADFTQQLKINPDNAIIYGNRGFSRYQLKDNQGAIEDFTQALKINPNDPVASSLRGYARYAIGDMQGAVEDFTQVLRVNPKDANTYINRANTLYVIGEQERALEDYTQALRIEPNNAVAFFRRGNTRYDLGDKHGAMKDFTQALRIIPDFAQAYFQRGDVCYQLEDEQGAIDDFTWAITIDSNFAEAYFKRGYVRYEMGDKAGAIEDFTQVIRIHSNLAEAYYNRGVAHNAIGNRKEATEDYHQAIKINPKLSNFEKVDLILCKLSSSYSNSNKDYEFDKEKTPCLSGQINFETRINDQAEDYRHIGDLDDYYDYFRGIHL